MTHPALKLRTRIGLYFLALVAGWTLFVLLLLSNLLSRQSRAVVLDGGAQTARALALEAAPLVHYEDMASLNALAQRYVDPQSDFRYVIVQRDDGEVVFSTFDHGVPRALLNLGHTIQAGRGVTAELIRTDQELLYDYEARSAGVRVRLGMSLTTVETFAQELTSVSLWVGVAALLAVLAVTLHVSRPVEALMTAVSKAVRLEPGTIKEGPLYSTVETKALALWFREMVSKLEESSRRLDQSKKLAYLGEISTSIAHEINNPLGVIVLNSKFLTKRVAAGEITQPAAEEVERVHSAAMRATLAAQKLLQFARYSTKSTGIKRRPMKVEQLLRETVELLRDRIQLAQCTVNVEVPPTLPKVSLDQQAIQQVLFNLLTNSLDATPSGGEIEVGAEISDGALLLHVADPGRGMDTDLLARAKDPFVTTKDIGKGTGLGLAISDSIVRTHGGELVLESSPETGTVATVRLPLGSAA